MIWGIKYCVPRFAVAGDPQLTRDTNNAPALTIILNMPRLSKMAAAGETLEPALGHELVHAKHALDDFSKYSALIAQKGQRYRGGDAEEHRTYAAEDKLRSALKKTDPKKFADLPSSHRMLETKLYELGVK